MEPIKFPSADHSSGRQLAGFIMELKRFIGSLVNDDETSSFFYAEMLPEMRKVWPEVEDRFGSYVGHLADAQEQQLQEHGLTKQELQFKFNVIKFFQRRFFGLMSSGSTTLARKSLKKLLEVIDILFRSALSVVPGGGAIEEYKNFTEALVIDEND